VLWADAEEHDASLALEEASAQQPPAPWADRGRGPQESITGRSGIGRSLLAGSRRHFLRPRLIRNRFTNPRTSNPACATMMVWQPSV
jgi:hypothetical protein